MNAVVACQGLTHAYGKQLALDNLSLALPVGKMVGLIGPDGVGKSTLLGLIAGARQLQQGSLQVLEGDIANATHRRNSCPKIAYMPQGLGKNLYPTLSVAENVEFFGRLFGLSKRQRLRQAKDVLNSTGLGKFLHRPAGKLSGGMKQKLGLCCALIHDPDLLILDEPTTGVDPLSRRQFWQLIQRIRARRPHMSVLVATAYMEEAQQFDYLVAMDDGKVLATGSPESLLSRTNSDSLEDAFVSLLPAKKRNQHHSLTIAPIDWQGQHDIAIEARGLTCRFGDFTAVKSINLTVRKGEIFGFLGSNGCGKSTTMKMLTGLLPASEGEAFLFGQPVAAEDLDSRRKVGYMSQAFSLYSELTVRQNLRLHGKLFDMPEPELSARVDEMLTRFDLHKVADTLPDNLPLGIRQRLSLAVAVIHRPEMLILDEPTSGVDPVARDNFWALLGELSRNDGVTIFISTHFMNEALRCDRISLMHAGEILATNSPQGLVEQSAQTDLESAFIHYLQQASADTDDNSEAEPEQANLVQHVTQPAQPSKTARFSVARFYSYAWREALELKRDPMRLLLALCGTVLLMLIMGYGITTDVEDLRFAVLDRDQTLASRTYTENIAGSRYFEQQPDIVDYQQLDKRLRSGDISVALEIPSGFGRDLQRGLQPDIGVWIDGAMPQRAETISGYLSGMHQTFIQQQYKLATGFSPSSSIGIEQRFRYNPDVRSLVAMVPAIIPLLLMFIPAMLTALGVVREKEMGSMLNLYVTPVTRLEFLLAKQLPYMALAMVNFALLVAMSLWLFEVPIKGSIGLLTLAAFLYVGCATALGLLASALTQSQIAAIFGTTLLTLIPAIQFSGLFSPTAALEGGSAVASMIYPTTHFLVICRGIFSKALGWDVLSVEFYWLLASIPVLLTLATLMLKKQGK